MPDRLSAPMRLLLVEDNAADIFLMEMALELSPVATELMVARDGLEALDLLGQAKAGGPFPDLILLDLNMPRVDGFEFLQALRADPHLTHLPAIVLTTSNDPADVRRAYALQANSYLTKPGTLEDFLQLIESLTGYWFGKASIPQTYQPQ